MFNYNKAIVRQVSDSFFDALSIEKRIEQIDLKLTDKQHAQYVDKLSEIVDIIEIPKDNTHPDCVFIEDPLFIYDGKVIFNNLGHVDRKGEINGIKEILPGLLPNMQFFDMPIEAELDGGDVLVTGHEILVGLTKRTNLKGIEFIQQIHPDHNVRIIVVDGGLHLKSLVSAMDENTLVVINNKYGNRIKQQISVRYNYEWIMIKEQVCCNVLRINGYVFIQKGFADGDILEKEISNRGLICVKLEMSEFIKADGALTCCCVPIKIDNLIV